MRETFAKTRESLLPLIDEEVIPVVGGFIGATVRGARNHTRTRRFRLHCRDPRRGSSLRRDSDLDRRNRRFDCRPEGGARRANNRAPVLQSKRRSLLISAPKCCIRRRFNRRSRIVFRCGSVTRARRKSVARLLDQKRKPRPARSKLSRTKKASRRCRSLPRACSALTVFCARSLKSSNVIARWWTSLPRRKSVCHCHWTTPAALPMIVDELETLGTVRVEKGTRDHLRRW